MKPKWNEILVVALFLVSITLPIMFSDIKGGKLSEKENRYLAPFPTFLTEDLKLAPSIKIGTEKWLDDNIGFRTQIKEIQSYIDIKLFHISPSSNVVIGKAGWYYFTGDNNIAIGLGAYQLPEDTLIKIKDNLVTAQERFANKEANFVLMLVPSKASIYPEYVRGRVSSPITVIDTVSDYLRNTTTIPIINTKPNLLEAKNSDLVYFKNDTHWNPMGSYIGYRALINSLNELGMTQTQAVDITTQSDYHVGDLIRLMGAEDFLPAEPYQALQILSPRAEIIEGGEYYDDLVKILQLYDPVPNFYLFQNGNAEQKTVLLFGDSFMMGNLSTLLAQNCSTLVVIHTFDLRNEVLEFVKPDIVIREVTERYIFILSW